MKPESIFSSLASSVDDTARSIIESGLEEPFYVVDVQDILMKHKKWLISMPRVRPFYAVKCNSSALVLELLASLGLGFDCASKAEIDTILNLGVHADDIIYANPCKTKSFIKHASSLGVDLMTFDNEAELYKVAQFHKQAKLVLRIKVDDSHSVCRFSAKFGAELEDAGPLLQLAKSLGLEVVGVSFHVGSGCESADSFRDAIKNARIVFNQGLALGFDMGLLDLGGGWPGTSNPEVTFEEMASVVTDALAQYFPEEDADGKKSKVQVIAEPGRYYVASAFVLAATVIAKRTLKGDSGEHRVMYYINDGVYGSFNCTIFDHVHPEPLAFLPLDQLEQRAVHPSTIWGPTCDSMDQVAKDVTLPELEVGEWMVFREMGAYTIAAATTFNGFQLPSMKYFVPSHSIEALRQLPRWPMISQILDLDDAHSLASESEDEFAFENFDCQLIAVH